MTEATPWAPAAAPLLAVLDLDEKNRVRDGTAAAAEGAAATRLRLMSIVDVEVERAAKAMMGEERVEWWFEKEESKERDGR